MELILTYILTATLTLTGEPIPVAQSLYKNRFECEQAKTAMRNELAVRAPGLAVFVESECTAIEPIYVYVEPRQ